MGRLKSLLFYLYLTMNKLYPILFFLLVVALVVVYFHKPSGVDQKLIEQQKKHALAMDSSARVAEAWRLKALEYGNQYRAEATRAIKVEQGYNYLREENERLKRRPIVRYAEPQLDSMFSARYPN